MARAKSSGIFTAAYVRAFTLIEILVVVAIIALLISILLPSLARARDQARGVVCLANLSQLGRAETIYQTQNAQWIPGSPLTTGYAYLYSGGIDLYGPGLLGFNRLSVQLFDWNTPLRAIMYGPNSIPRGTGNTWTDIQQRIWLKAFDEAPFACPMNPERYGPYNHQGFPIIHASSYLSLQSFMSPANDYKPPSTTPPGSQYAYKQMFEMQAPLGYRPRHSRLARESLKVFLADGFRFYDGNSKDYDPSTNGAWSSFCENQPPDLGGTNTRSWGPARALSYRHRGQSAINVVMFDGHAEQFQVSFNGLGPTQVGYSGRAVDPRYYHPTGTTIQASDLSVLHKRMQAGLSLP